MKTPDHIYEFYCECRKNNGVNTSLTLTAKKFNIDYEEVCKHLGFKIWHTELNVAQ